MDSEINVMEKENTHLFGEDLVEVDLVEVDFAQEFQDAIISSKVLTFATEDLKNKILNARKEQLIVVTSTINSPKIVKEVNYYDEEFVFESL